MNRSTQRITDHRGRVLIVEQEHMTLRNGWNGTVVSDDPMDGPEVGRYCTRYDATIDGEPASKRRVAQFIRRAREHMEKKEAA